MILLSASALKLGFSTAGSMQSCGLENTGHKEGMGGVLPIYLAMLDGAAGWIMDYIDSSCRSRNENYINLRR